MEEVVGGVVDEFVTVGAEGADEVLDLGWWVSLEIVNKGFVMM